MSGTGASLTCPCSIRLRDRAIIETRDALIHAIEMSANNPDLPEYKTGVLQT